MEDNGPALYKYQVISNSRPTGLAPQISISMQNLDNTRESLAVPMPASGVAWEYKWSQTGKRYLYLGACKSNFAWGTVTVRIYRNDKIIAERTSPDVNTSQLCVEIDGLY